MAIAYSYEFHTTQCMKIYIYLQNFHSAIRIRLLGEREVLASRGANHSHSHTPRLITSITPLAHAAPPRPRNGSNHINSGKRQVNHGKVPSLTNGNFAEPNIAKLYESIL